MMCGGGLSHRRRGTHPGNRETLSSTTSAGSLSPCPKNPGLPWQKWGLWVGVTFQSGDRFLPTFSDRRRVKLVWKKRSKKKKKNSTVIESCLLPFERNESGIKQKHRIQTKTKTKILYCFRICLGNNCLTVFCVILKSRVCSTALFCTWPRAVCREAGLWVTILLLPRSISHSLSIYCLHGVEKRVSGALGRGLGGGVLNIQLSKYQVSPSLRDYL